MSCDVCGMDHLEISHGDAMVVLQPSLHTDIEWFHAMQSVCDARGVHIGDPYATINDMASGHDFMSTQERGAFTLAIQDALMESGYMSYYSVSDDCFFVYAYANNRADVFVYAEETP